MVRLAKSRSGLPVLALADGNTKSDVMGDDTILSTTQTIRRRTSPSEQLRVTAHRSNRSLAESQNLIGIYDSGLPALVPFDEQDAIN